VRARIVFLASLIALSGVACTRSLDTQGLEEQIAADLEAGGGPTVNEVTCPDDVEVESGGTFECTATGEGVEWRISVTQLDDDGRVEFQIVAPEG
jgi:hypothetical protein